MKSLRLLLLLAASALTFCGCTSSEYVLDLKGASLGANDNVVQDKIIYVADVTDNRFFVNKAEDPSVPNGVLLSADYKSRAYATFKPMLSDDKSGILVAPDKSIASLVKEHLVKAFSDAGYAVVTDMAADIDESSVIVVAASIKNFWAWTELSKVTCNMKVDITTDVYMQYQTRQKHMYLSSKFGREVITDTKEMYQKIANEALSNYTRAAAEKIKTTALY